MNKLIEIVIRWSMHRVGFHTDIAKMYNSVKLAEDHWCLQRYVWQENLDPAMIPEEKVIKTLIYGVRSSGNLAERGLRETSHIYKEQYPEVNRIVEKDIYVDDCVSGEVSTDLAFRRADEIIEVLMKGGFSLKGFTFSGKSPSKDVSEDGESINVAGMRWFPKKDELQLDVSDLNFSKKLRGKKKVTEDSDKIPSNLTRRHCVGKVAEIFDLTGRITPITASMKLDLHDLVQRGLTWDDKIPDELRSVWLSHFQMMKEIKNIRFKRVIIPEDALSLEIDTIDMADASKSVACIAIYARCLRKCGEYSCQLVFGRSKLIPDGMTQPRAELLAANLNAHTGEVVRRSFGEYHKSAVKLTDSQITLNWIHNRELPLKQWIRNRVVDICRFNLPESWRYIRSKDMVADVGTRRGATIQDVSPGSIWQEGYSWMKLEPSKFPVKALHEIKLNSVEISDMKKEMAVLGKNNENLSEFEWPQESSSHTSYVALNPTTGRCVPKDVATRYQFSYYILDPNKQRFKTVVRIIGIVQRFIKNFIKKYHKVSKQKEDSQSPVNSQQLDRSNHQEQEESFHTTDKTVILSDEELQEARNYYYKKATLEVKHFVSASKYKNISVEKGGILYYTGRILPNQKFNVVANMTEVMKDLTSTTFYIPIVDKHSPVAYSVVNEVHWHHNIAKHSGIETVLRYTMSYCYILEGREIVKAFRKNCTRCRLLAKRTIDISMGPLSKYNLTIAPAFYITQVDLCGPFKAFSEHNKRATLKIYLVVFCCCTTSSVNIKVMEDYGTSSFIQAFIRFSCEVGFPKMILPDAGSQLFKGCKTMKLNYQDVKSKLHLNHNVEFEPCPVGGHNMHGRVGRRISVKESLSKSLQNERLSIIQWETLSAQISNSINDLPLALRSLVSELENIDLITPNRLKLGRNNDRSPVGPMVVTSNPTRFLRDNEQIFNCWFEAWLISCVPQLIKQPKWFNTDFDLNEGDVVLFLKEEGSLVGQYQYGIVDAVEKGRDGKARTVHVKYQNSNENTARKTRRAARELIVIHPIDEVSLMSELGEIATFADVKRKLELKLKQSSSS